MIVVRRERGPPLRQSITISIAFAPRLAGQLEPLEFIACVRLRHHQRRDGFGELKID